MKRALLLLSIILLLTAACYLPILKNGFVWDDHVILMDNSHYRGFTPSHLLWMFTTFHDAQYHPVVWMTFGLDYQIWKMNPAGYHLTSLFWHLANALILFFFMRIFFKTPALAGRIGNNPWTNVFIGFGVLFFSLHPFHVESVAFASARGNLMSAAFLMLSVTAYLEYARHKGQSRVFYFLALAAYGVSLLCKAWGITLPLILLILDHYPLRRISAPFSSLRSNAKLILEKWPFFVLSLAASIPAFLAKAQKGQMADLNYHDTLSRLMQSAYGLVFYAVKALVPLNFSPLYLLHKNHDFLKGTYILSVIVLAGLFIFLWFWGRRRAGLLTAFLCYAVILLPILGIVQAGPQLVADRYAYIATLPFAFMVAFGCALLWNRLNTAGRLNAAPGGTNSSQRNQHGFYNLKTAAWMILLMLGLTFLFVQSTVQTRVWRNGLTLWNRVISVEDDNYWAYLARASELDERGEIRLALDDYSKSIKYNPQDYRPYVNRGVIRKNLGDIPGAMEDFNTAVRLAPNFVDAYVNRGVTNWDRLDLHAALADFSKALENAPKNWEKKEEVLSMRDTVLRELKGENVVILSLDKAILK